MFKAKIELPCLDGGKMGHHYPNLFFSLTGGGGPHGHLSKKEVMWDWPVALRIKVPGIMRRASTH